MGCVRACACAGRVRERVRERARSCVHVRVQYGCADVPVRCQLAQIAGVLRPGVPVHVLVP